MWCHALWITVDHCGSLWHWDVDCLDLVGSARVDLLTMVGLLSVFSHILANTNKSLGSNMLEHTRTCSCAWKGYVSLWKASQCVVKPKCWDSMWSFQWPFCFVFFCNVSILYSTCRDTMTMHDFNVFCVPRWLAVEPQLQCPAMPWVWWVRSEMGWFSILWYPVLDKGLWICKCLHLPSQVPVVLLSARTYANYRSRLAWRSLGSLGSLGLLHAEEWRLVRPDLSNGQLLPGSMQQPCSLGAKEISDRFDALRPLLGQGHCHSVRGFKSGQVSL